MPDVKLVSPEAAARLVPDGATVIVGGSGAGHAVPQRFIDALAAVYRSDGRPRDLTTVRVVGVGDFGDRGFSQLAIPGLMRRTIGSNIGNEPRLGAMVARGEVEAYSFPQGVLSQLCREIAAGRPGLITKVGLATYVDPRQTGGRQGPATVEDLVEVIEVRGEEWLLYRSFPIDVAVIRGSTIDEQGNLTLDDEAINGEMLAMAMAAHNADGIVIAQARTVVPVGDLIPRRVHVPGALVDYAFVDPEQTQTYATDYSPYYSGAARTDAPDSQAVPLDVRKVIARRSLLEFGRGEIANLGFGISQSIGAIAQEEDVADLLVLTVEQGVFGGIPAGGNDGGAGVNYQALIDQPYMFDFYDGGGLDVASLSFAEVDRNGNVNVHAFGDRLRGPGGFPNISRGAKKVCFVGTLTTAGMKAVVADGSITIVSEGSIQRFVEEVEQITFNGRVAAEQGQEVRYITERAVFALVDGTVTLTEIAEGLEPETDVIAHMGFRPAVSRNLTTIDPAVFSAGTMGLRDRLQGANQ